MPDETDAKILTGSTVISDQHFPTIYHNMPDTKEASTIQYDSNRLHIFVMRCCTVNLRGQPESCLNQTFSYKASPPTVQKGRSLTVQLCTLYNRVTALEISSAAAKH